MVKNYNKRLFKTWLIAMSGLMITSQVQAQSTELKAQNLKKANAEINILQANLTSQKQLAFIPNKGQWPSYVIYKADMPGGQAIVTKDGLIAGVFDPTSLQAEGAYHEQMEVWQHDSKALPKPEAPAGVKGHGWKIRFTGGTEPDAQLITNAVESKEYYNWLGSTQSGKDVVGVHSYAEITYHNIYSGVDVRYYAAPDGSGLENDIIVAPGADANKVSFIMDGIDKYNVTDDGLILLHTSVGDVGMAAPVSYTLASNGIKTPVPSKYKINADKSISFYLGSYDHQQQLVIDPIVMRWATLIGNNATGNSHNHAIDLDQSGNIYTAGFYSPTQLITVGGFQTSSTGSLAAFFGKYTEPATVGGAGTRVWQTYLGSGAAGTQNTVNAIAIGPDGNIYAAGYSQADMATVYGTGFTAPTYTNRTYAGSNQMISVYKVSTDGMGAITRTLGAASQSPATSVNSIFGLKLISTGGAGFDLILSGYSVLGAGFAGSGDLPAPVLPDGSASTTDGTVGTLLSLSNNFATINWIKLIGSNANNVNRFYTVALDAANNIYAAGSSTAPSAMSYNNLSSQTTNTGVTSAWILKASATGSVLSSRYFQSTAGSFALIYCMTVTRDNNALLIGGITNRLVAANIVNPIQAAYGGGNGDFFVASLPLNLSTTTWGTYLGGAGYEQNMMGLATDANSDVYILGYSTSATGFPVSTQPIQAVRRSSASFANNATFTKLNAAGSNILYSTWLGGVGDDYDPVGNAGIKFANCRIYLAISSNSTDFPLTNGALTTNKLSAATVMEPILISMANPPDFTGASSVNPVAQTITCGSTAADIVHSAVTYNIPEIIRGGVLQVTPSTGAYPSNVPTVTTGSLQWQKSIDGGSTWTNIAGATDYTLTSAQIGNVVQDTKYRLTINADACNRTEEPIATISVGGDPSAAPTAACAGGNTTFAANATGTGVLNYTWVLPMSSGRANPGDVANFVVATTVATDAGVYQITVSNTGGCKTTKTYYFNTVSCSFLPLPVKLGEFSARKNGGGNQSILNWESLSEINTEGYTIQRSMDGISWNEIGYVKATGNATNKTEYKFIDVSPAQGNNFYRLFVTDLNGVGDYSQTRILNYLSIDQSAISLYPNPTNNAITLTGVNKGDRITIVSMDGKIVVTSNAYGASQGINVSKLAVGNYLLNVQNDTRTLKSIIFTKK